MTKVAAQVQVDDSVLASIDATAQRFGRSRDEVIEDSVRRDLAGRLLGGLFSLTPVDREPLTDEDVAALVYDEIRHTRELRRRPQG